MHSEAEDDVYTHADVQTHSHTCSHANKWVAEYRHMHAGWQTNHGNGNHTGWERRHLSILTVVEAFLIQPDFKTSTRNTLGQRDNDIPTAKKQHGEDSVHHFATARLHRRQNQQMQEQKKYCLRLPRAKTPMSGYEPTKTSHNSETEMKTCGELSF